MYLIPASLDVWRSEGKRGVWIKIPLFQSELIPTAAKVGGRGVNRVGVLMWADKQDVSSH